MNMLCIVSFFLAIILQVITIFSPVFSWTRDFSNRNQVRILLIAVSIGLYVIAYAGKSAAPLVISIILYFGVLIWICKKNHSKIKTYSLSGGMPAIICYGISMIAPLCLPVFSYKYKGIEMSIRLLEVIKSIKPESKVFYTVVFLLPSAVGACGNLFIKRHNSIVFNIIILAFQSYIYGYIINTCYDREISIFGIGFLTPVLMIILISAFQIATIFDIKYKDETPVQKNERG